jgi:hypothetical protein
MLLTQQGLNKFQCDSNCTHDHSQLFFHGKCHPSAKVEAVYIKASGSVIIRCARCSQKVTEIAVATGLEKETKMIRSATVIGNLWPRCGICNHIAQDHNLDRSCGNTIKGQCPTCKTQGVDITCPCTGYDGPTLIQFMKDYMTQEEIDYYRWDISTAKPEMKERALIEEIARLSAENSTLIEENSNLKVEVSSRVNPTIITIDNGAK